MPRWRGSRRVFVVWSAVPSARFLAPRLSRSFSGRRCVVGNTKRENRGRAKGSAKQKHYKNKKTNLVEGIEQDLRRAKEDIDESIDSGPEPKRVKGHDEDLDLIRKAGGEKFPGCGTLILLDVGRHEGREGWTSAKIVSEARFDFRLDALHRANFYEVDRRDRPKVDGEWQKQPKYPGLVRETTTSWAPYDRALKKAIEAKVLSPADFQAWLAQTTWLMAPLWEKATKFKGCRKGLEMECIAAHLQQGVLHIHPYSRDCDLETHKRLGLFRSDGKRSRLVLANLAPGDLGAWRQRKFGLKPVPKWVPASKRKGGKFIPGHIVEDWSILDRALKGRRRRMGADENDEKILPPDVVLANFWDGQIAELRAKRPELEVFFKAEEEEESARNVAEVAAARKELGLADRDDAVEAAKAEKERREKAESTERKAKDEAEAAMRDKLQAKAQAEAAEVARADAVKEAEAKTASLAAVMAENERLSVQVRAFRIVVEAWAPNLELLIAAQAHVLAMKKPSKEMMTFLRVAAEGDRPFLLRHEKLTATHVSSLLVPYEVRPEVRVYVEALALLSETRARAALSLQMSARMGLRKFTVDELEDALEAVSVRKERVYREEDAKFFTAEFEARMDLHQLSVRKAGFPLQSHTLVDMISSRMAELRKLEAGGISANRSAAAAARAKQAIVRAQKEAGELGRNVKLVDFSGWTKDLKEAVGAKTEPIPDPDPDPPLPDL